MNELASKLGKGITALALIVLASGCGEPAESVDPDPEENGPTVDPARVEEELPGLLEEAGAEAIELPEAQDPAKVELGRMLFFDPILSGNKDTNCATCHHPTNATVTTGSLAVGTKPAFQDGARVPGLDHTFTPRNPPGLFNLGDPALDTVFWDGRMQRLDDGRIVLHDQGPKSPGNYLRVMPDKIDNILAGQVMFPVTDRDEMRGDYGETDINGEPNEVAQRTDIDFEGIWRDLTERLMAIDGYRDRFAEVYPSVDAEDVTFHLAANALAAFIIETFSFDDSPWDNYLRGQEDALTDEEKYGAWLFYGKAGCADCHSGRRMTDQEFHNIGVRPISSGPVLGRETDHSVDRGVAHRTFAGDDQAFAFKTPSLRNVALTAPYMHNGAYTNLEDVIRHKMAMHDGLWDYDYTKIEERFWEQVHTNESVIESVEPSMSMNETPQLTEEEIDALVAFMESLTSPSAAQMTGIEPEEVPSGLPIPEP